MNISIQKIRNFFLYCFFFSVNFEVWDPLNTGGYFSLSKLFGIFYFLSLISNFNNFFYISKRDYTFILPLFIFYIILLLNNIFNFSNYSNDVLSFSILINIIFFIFICNHEKVKPGSIEKGFVFFLLGALISTIAYFFNIGTEVNIDGRVSLFGDDENVIGFRMVVASILITHLIIKYKKSKKIVFLLIFCYFPVVTLLFNTGSRLSVINLVSCLSFFIIFYKFKYYLNKIIVLAFFSIFISYVVNMILNSEVVGKRLMLTIEEGNLAGRDDIWKSILPLINDNLIIGVGQSGYIEYMQKLTGEYKSPHNVLLEVLAFTGLIGLFFYLTFIFSCFFNSLKKYFYHGDIVPLVFAIPIAGLLVSGQLLVVKLGWFLLAYAATRKYHIK